MSKVMVALAQGCEEIEAVTVIDVLRRAEIEVDVVSINADDSLSVTASRGVKLEADLPWSKVDPANYQMLVLPGGLPGVENLRDHPGLIAALQARPSEQWLGAICAAPGFVLASHDLLGSATITGYPGSLGAVPSEQLSTQAVVNDESAKLITSQGPGTAMEFALALVEQLLGKDKARQVAEPMLINY